MHMSIIMACLLLLPSGTVEPADLELAQTILAARDAGRAEFTHWTIRFQYTVAKAEDLESALARRWTDEAIGDGLSAFDGTRGRHEILFSPRDMAEKRSKGPSGGFSTYLRAFRSLTDGKATLSDRIDVNRDGKTLEHSAQIYPGKERFYDELFLPLGLGRLSKHGDDQLSDDIQDIVDGRPDHAMTIREGARLFGRDLIELTFTTAETWLRAADPIVTTKRYWVDLEQGATVRKLHRLIKNPEYGEQEFDEVWEDVRRVGDSAWFPYRDVSFSRENGVVRDRVIIEADFVNVPPRSMFHLTFDTPIKVSARSGSITYPARKVWDLEYLPRPEPSPKPFRPKPSRWNRVMNALASNWRSIVGVTLIAIPVVMAVRLVLKRRHDV
jgi:hypothetical protein